MHEGMHLSELEADSAVGTAQSLSRADRSDSNARPAARLPSWMVVVVPALAELVVGGYKIAGPSLWRDEASTISASHRPVGAIFALMSHEDAIHIPYYLIMHAVITIGGVSETILRLPSLVAMCAAVGLTAAIGRRLAEASGLPAPAAAALGVAAGLLLTTVPQTTRYAQEARPYALATLFAVLSTYLLLRAAEAGNGVADHRRRWWLSYALALTLTGMFNLFALLVAAGHGLSLLAARGTGKVRSSRRARPQAADGAIADGTIIGWLSACTLAAV